MISWKYLYICFSPVYKGIFMSLDTTIALSSLFFFSFCLLFSARTPLLLFPFLLSMLRFLTFRFSKRLWWITAFKKRLSFTVHFVCILHRSPASPVEHAMTWQWWRGWMEGELHAVKSEADTANTEKQYGGLFLLELQGRMDIQRKSGYIYVPTPNTCTVSIMSPGNCFHVLFIFYNYCVMTSLHENVWLYLSSLLFGEILTMMTTEVENN